MLQLSHLSQVHQVQQYKPDSWINLPFLNNVTHTVEVLLHQVLHTEKDILNQFLTVSHAFPCTCTFPLSWSISFPMVDISLAKHSRDSPSEDDLSSLIIHSCMMASESSYGREREGGMRKEGWRLHVRGDGARGMQSLGQNTKHLREPNFSAAPHTLSLNSSPINLMFPRDLWRALNSASSNISFRCFLSSSYRNHKPVEGGAAELCSSIHISRLYLCIFSLFTIWLSYWEDEVAIHKYSELQ